MSSHLDDLLSAYTDAEVTPDEAASVEAHLADCTICRRELVATRQAKSWLSGLPEVLPPFGFYERMLLDPTGPREPRQHWSLRVGAIGLAATASIWLAVVGLAGIDASRPSGIPALNSLVSLHERTPANDPSPGPDTELEQRAAALGLPATIDDYEVADVVDRGDEQQVSYTDGTATMSVFVLLRYDVDESSLPAGSEERTIGGHRAWMVPGQPSPVVVAQIGINAIVLVGPDRAAPAMTEGVEPAPSTRSILDRVQGAGEGLLEAFGLG